MQRSINEVIDKLAMPQQSVATKKIRELIAASQREPHKKSRDQRSDTPIWIQIVIQIVSQICSGIIVFWITKAWDRLAM
jgi:hypothetical protein